MAGHKRSLPRENRPSPRIALIAQGGDLAWFIDGDTSIASATGNAILAGQAHHVVAAYGASRAAIYVDGEEVANVSDPLPLDLDPLNAWFFGGFGALAFAGSIDDVQLYDRQLSAEEIRTLSDHPGVPLSSGEPRAQPPVGERFDLLRVGSSEGKITIGWTAAQDVGYRVEFSPDLERWVTIEDTRFSVEVNEATLEDTNADRVSQRAGFYRVVLLP